MSTSAAIDELELSGAYDLDIELNRFVARLVKTARERNDAGDEKAEDFGCDMLRAMAVFNLMRKGWITESDVIDFVNSKVPGMLSH